MELVQGADIMDNLKVISNLMKCADQKYVVFDLEKVKSSMEDADVKQ